MFPSCLILNDVQIGLYITKESQASIRDVPLIAFAFNASKIKAGRICLESDGSACIQPVNSPGGSGIIKSELYMEIILRSTDVSENEMQVIYFY